ncbi:arginine--tRNA ligase [Candidatus Woesearchaeota archaeon]|nr:arginine--tRNA ligase [Candidatus Woesearchaeota archaeon]
MNVFRDAVAKLISDETGIPREEAERHISIPPSQDLGDFAFPCFSLSKKLRMAPDRIAVDLKSKISPGRFFEKVEAHGPYLNFFMNRAWMAGKVVDAVMVEGKDYGSLKSKGTVLVEHTSINPNASPHVGRARNSIIGDSIVRLLRFHGYKVDAHFFVNDIGKQIALLVLGCRGRKLAFKDMLSEYIRINSELEADPGIERDVFALLKKLEDGDKEVRKEFRQVVEMCVKGQSGILYELGIRFDCFDYESDYLFSRKTGEVLGRLESSGKVFVDAEGRKVLNLEGFNLDMKSPVLVLTRADGTSLYGLRDLAYTVDKLSKGRNIVVLGEDHKLYFRQLSAALSLLGFPAPEAVHYSFVLLASGKMSTRSGNVVLLEDFMSQALEKAEAEIRGRKKARFSKQLARSIGYGALKYHIIKVSPEKNVTFDWDHALSFEGESAPYIQYAHARIAGIISKAGHSKKGKVDYSLLKTSVEHELVKLLADFPDVAEKAALQLRPHLIANYAQSLADCFNRFYHECPVISDDHDLSTARLVLVSAARQVLETSLNLLGIEAVRKM